jgi:TetR/AcrR family transcriptional regulator, transcriptional repressor for nem operon
MPRGRPREFDEKRALAAAMGVFWRKGFEGASCDELQAAMGIKSGSMYCAFGDKQSLYDKAFDLYCDTVFQQGMEILDGPGTPLENVRALVQCMGEGMSAGDCKGCFVGNTLIEFAAENEGVAEMARRMMNRLQDALEKKLGAAREIGELGDHVDPEEMAVFLVSTAQGLNVMARAGADEKAIRGVVNTTLSLLR